MAGHSGPADGGLDVYRSDDREKCRLITCTLFTGRLTSSART
jgi:hypothetical protein